MLSHEEMMNKAWRFIEEVGITEDEKEFAKNNELYLVKNIYEVRDAYYKDLENGIKYDEDFPEFLNRHNIAWR